MFKVHLVNAVGGKINLQGQLITIRETNIQTSLQIFVKLMHYFTKFTNFFTNKCKFDIKFNLGGGGVKTLGRGGGVGAWRNRIDLLIFLI